MGEEYWEDQIYGWNGGAGYCLLSSSFLSHLRSECLDIQYVKFFVLEIKIKVNLKSVFWFIVFFSFL